MENFCTEIFLEIFDYLEGGTLYQAFKGLNARFERLLDVSNLRLKTYQHCKLFGSSQACYKALIAPNKQRILSLDVHFTWSHNLLRSGSFLDASFIRLQSLTLQYVRKTSLISLLIVLADIPLLTALYIRLGDDLTDLTDTYQRIFALPLIRFLEVVTYVLVEPISLPISRADRCTRLESLNFDHDCSVGDLLTLLSYTPRLRRLTDAFIIESEVVVPRAGFTAIPSLTRISISSWQADFSSFETLLTEISPELQYLWIHCSRPADFLNAAQWERVLSQHLSHLTRLDFTYEEPFQDQFVVTQDHKYVHGFSSPFWTKKHWRFNIVIDNGDGGESIVYYWSISFNTCPIFTRSSSNRSLQ